MGKNQVKRQKLTDGGIERAEVRKEGYEIWDIDPQWLRLTVSAKGKKSLGICKFWKGGPYKEKICDAGAMPIADIRVRAKELLALLARGINPKEQAKQEQEAKEQAEKAALTLAQVYAKYEQHKGNGRTFFQVKRYWEKYLKPLHDKKLSDISTMDLEDRVLDLKNRGKGPQANRVAEFVGRLFNFARGMKYRGDNPADDYEQVPETPSDKFFSTDHHYKLLKAVKDEPDLDTRHLFQILFFVGCRVSNACKVEFSEVDFEKKIWRIPSSKSKNKRTMDIPLNDVAFAVFQERRELVDGKFVISPLSEFER